LTVGDIAGTICETTTPANSVINFVQAVGCNFNIYPPGQGSLFEEFHAPSFSLGDCRKITNVHFVAKFAEQDDWPINTNIRVNNILVANAFVAKSNIIVNNPAPPCYDTIITFNFNFNHFNGN